MKKTLFIMYVLAVSAFSASAQLPPVAQALYDEAYLHDSAQVSFALSHGAQIKATPDGNSFYVQWFPAGTPSTKPVVVTLHGSSGYAFAEFYNWFLQAQSHGCGLIALQWYKGITVSAPNDYFNDTIIYTDIDTALTRIGYPSGKAFLHGFSRAAARSYAIVFLDAHGGKNYFCTTLANSGSAQSTYPLYADINSGVHGTNVFAGKRFTFFCGGLDPDPAQSGCTGMGSTKTWLQAQGATVDIFIQDAALGHDGFHTVPAYMDSVLDYYTSCFNGTLSVPEENNSIGETKIFPNPFDDNITIAISEMHFQQSSLIIRNMMGATLFSQQENNHTGPYTKTIHLNFLTPGIYLLEIGIDGRREQKVIIKQ